MKEWFPKDNFMIIIQDQVLILSSYWQRGGDNRSFKYPVMIPSRIPNM